MRFFLIKEASIVVLRAMFQFSHMLIAVTQKTLDEMPQAVVCRCSGKRITGVPLGLETSELCREQLNTLTIGDDSGFLC